MKNKKMMKENKKKKRRKRQKKMNNINLVPGLIKVKWTLVMDIKIYRNI